MCGFQGGSRMVCQDPTQPDVPAAVSDSGRDGARSHSGSHQESRGPGEHGTRKSWVSRTTIPQSQSIHILSLTPTTSFTNNL